jgi:hypothetical protein
VEDFPEHPIINPLFMATEHVREFDYKVKYSNERC